MAEGAATVEARATDMGSYVTLKLCVIQESTATFKRQFLRSVKGSRLSWIRAINVRQDHQCISKNKAPKHSAKKQIHTGPWLNIW